MEQQEEKAFEAAGGEEQGLIMANEEGIAGSSIPPVSDAGLEYPSIQSGITVSPR